MSARATLVAACLLGASGVALGAFGAHGLEGTLSLEELGWWNTAARYQQIHAVALLAMALGGGIWSKWRRWACSSMAVGVVIFCLTLDAMALGAPKVLGAVTPLGGLGMIVGWALMLVHALRSEPDETSC